MGLGQAKREVHLPLAPERAFDLVAAAGQSIGKVSQEHRSLGALRVRTRFGLQTVRLRLTLVPDGDGTRLQIDAGSDDVWSMGARRGAERLVSAIDARMGAAATG